METDMQTLTIEEQQHAEEENISMCSRVRIKEELNTKLEFKNYETEK